MEHRHQLYGRQARKLLKSEPRAGIIKLSDFIDNCTGLKHNECAFLAGKLARKYYGPIPAFQQFVDNSVYFEGARERYPTKQLSTAKVRCLARMAHGTTAIGQDRPSLSIHDTVESQQEVA